LQKHIPLMVVGNGCRDSIFFCPRGISSAWHTNRYLRDSDAFDLAGNLYLYATDRNFPGKLTPRSRLARKSTAEKALKVAHVKYGGYWNPCPLALEKLSEVLAAKAGVKLETTVGVSPEDPTLGDHPAALLAAMKSCKLSDEQVAALTAYVDKGGVLILHATAGRPEDARVLTDLANRITGKDPRPLPADAALFTGKLGEVTGFDVQEIKYPPVLAPERRKERYPYILAAAKDKDGTVYVSVYDFLHGCSLQRPFRNRGYPVDTANQVAANLFLSVWAAQRP
jgi:hypothetical protein